MAKSRDSADVGKKSKASAKGAGGPAIETSVTTPAGSPAASAAEPLARSAGPTRRQVREIARLVGRLEALGELEARRRRQLQVALEKGRKTKRHRQQVDRAVGRVGELIDRLRTLARELESPVPSAAPLPSAPQERGGRPGRGAAGKASRPGHSAEGKAGRRTHACEACGTRHPVQAGQRMTLA